MELHTTYIIYNDEQIRLFYLRPYLPLTTAADPLSRSLLKFKRGRQPDLNTWIHAAIQALTHFPPSSDTIIIRALRHDETGIAPVPHPNPQHPPSNLTNLPPQSADPQSSNPSNQTIPPSLSLFPSFVGSFKPTSLDLLGQNLAAAFNCQYLPSLLLKSRPTVSNKGLTRDQRESELKDVYTVATHHLPSSSSTPPPSPPDASHSSPAHPSPFPSFPNNPPFLLIDDIFTTGATVLAIIHALRQSFPLNPIQIFTLTKATYNLTPPQPLT